MHIRTVAGGSATFAAALFALALSAQAADISVQLNQAKIVKLSRPADTIVIGNPQIADASVQDATTIVLTGKGFGSTNLVVLDDTGAPIVDEQVVVSRDEASTIRVFRRASMQTLSCTPNCEAAYMSAAEAMSEATRNGN
ncbi:pilus assembly protein N-terminal domain-containing protein [Arvimicrobium flavum]|uniref:pilus assembly protein N-terminal domain-containing protein n=1 Tax=Arvimicrobium flavum TaxID=3393320 RepID=UPI00237A3A26|nr:pilus assembly protein N-terminal domain-containing protein [Mesorhizobium shangrilense]